MTTAALEVHRLGKVYGELRALSDVSFSVAPGEVLGLVGPNGAGKTTTLRCLAGIIPPTEGTVHVGGRALATEPVEAKRRLAFLPDEPRLFEYLTVLEHLNLTARLYGVERWEPEAQRLLEEMELSAKQHVLPGELSRGMKQKLAIACGFLHAPDLILLDEPLTGLDPLGIRRMKQSLQARTSKGTALVLSSHLLTLVEELCDRVLVLAGGQIRALGTLEDIRAQAAGAAGADATLEDVFIQITSTPGPKSA